VLDSAGVMKAAVAYLEPKMEKKEGSQKGTIVLATVKGDVHDIGKNLVDIILSNNGYKVVNLGIKQPSDAIIKAAQEQKADAIGLSGLLVKSTLEMKYVVQDLHHQKLEFPVICGGAALTRKYVEDDLRREYNGGIFYADDAFAGLHLMEDLSSQDGARVKRIEEGKVVKEFARAAAAGVLEGEAATTPSIEIPAPPNIPHPPFWGTRVLRAADFDLREIFQYINETALFKNQWQLKTASQEDYARLVETKYRPVLKELQEEVIAAGWFEPKVVYGYFGAQGDGNDTVVYNLPEGWKQGDPIPSEALRFTFPRQREGRRLCISDFFLPKSSGRMDVIGMSCVTIGAKASQETQKLFEGGEYTKYLYLHGLSVETAEALAELSHKRLRAELGIGGDDSSHIRDLFHQKYRGSRYSFGYPACPNLEDQTKLFALLHPEETIGVHLTTGFLLEPEQSTSAIIVHHPAAKYFVA
jgi:5-methyltetrahydrofolate--homocysteine methyltransferase